LFVQPDAASFGFPAGSHCDSVANIDPFAGSHTHRHTYSYADHDADGSPDVHINTDTANHTSGDSLRAFLFYGNGNPQIISSPPMVRLGNMLHVHDGEQGFTLAIPRGDEAKAFGFNYFAPQEWVLAFGNFSLTLPAANDGFVGFVFHQDFPSEFRLSSAVEDQSGFALDNVAFVTFFMPVTPTMTPVPEATPLTP
jgi:hypothetical protein